MTTGNIFLGVLIASILGVDIEGENPFEAALKFLSENMRGDNVEEQLENCSRRRLSQRFDG